ncbi:RNA polymerase II mediator complex subunit [Emydomyces testavorans]|uniref:Mediator of RNA polymerase II transcription subunit 17 n=1 Tax=Emydomyces testavorans TaxID=2070801 RepID=A0AAF0IJF5_9EURO|nr:RNA polymerase II mediator complex subunit [Emydomyces testavorans]
MPRSFTLPLRPLREQDNRKDDLAIKIAQINAQRGSFRNVTEAGLRAEIEAARAAGKREAETADVETGEDEEQNKAEKLFKSRLEISQFAMNAHMEATYALESISLLLSKYTPRQAEMSMSPLLKQKVPLGSLATDQIKAPQQSESQRKEVDAVSRGWKLESFDAAATKLLQSAARLEDDMAAERRYWCDVLELKEKGWKLCRLPRERQTLGVHFGFLECAPPFRDRGLAALRQGEGGKLVLDRGIQAKTPQTVRVRIQKGDRTLGLSIPNTFKQKNGDSLDSQIRKARDGLFEEELFYELNRESRVLLQHGVETYRNLITFPADDTKQISVDLIRVDEELPDTETELTSLDTVLADTVAKSFRILLAYFHRKNHHRRTQVPASLTPNKRSTPECTIIQPILCYLQHRSHYQWFTSLFDNLTKTLQAAGLKCSYASHALVKGSQVHRDPTQQAATLSLVENFLDTLIGPLESIISCTLVSQSSGIRIRITTNVDPNGFGSEFELITNLSCFPGQQTPFRFGLREGMCDLVLYLFTLDLVHLIPSLVKKPGNDHGFEPQLSGYTAAQALAEEEPMDGDDDGDDLSELPASKRDAVYLLPWQPTFPQQGELTAFSPARCRTKKLQVQLKSDQLQLRCFWVERRTSTARKASGEKKPGEMTFTWRAADKPSEEGNTSRITLRQALEALGEKEDG